MNRTKTISRRGVTLAEVVVSTFLVSVVMLASLTSVGSAAITYRSSAAQTDGADVAGELVAEILALSYMDPQSPASPVGLDAGESRSAARTTLDDVDDYQGFSEASIKNRSGAVITGYAGWSRSVTVARVSATNPSLVLSGGSPDSGLKRISVVATGPDGKTCTLYALRSNCGGLQQPSPATGSVITTIDARLQIKSASAVTTGSAIINHSLGD